MVSNQSLHKYKGNPTPQLYTIATQISFVLLYFYINALFIVINKNLFDYLWHKSPCLISSVFETETFE